MMPPNQEKFISVILADDDEDDQKLFSEAIGETKLKAIVRIMTDGIDLVSKLEKTDKDIPDILFLDINMPQKSGLQCLDDIRRNHSLKELPIVIYSTSSYIQNIKDSFEKGASLYFMKPNSFSELVIGLKKILTIDWKTFNQNKSFDQFLL